MSGVIDNKGQQWERCHFCGNFIKFPQDLGYVRSMKYKHICVKCVDKELRAYRLEFNDINPAPSWQKVEVN